MMVTLSLLYILMLVEFLGGNSLIMMFVYLELLSWTFTLMLPSLISMKYLIMQAYFMILSLMGLLWLPALLMVGFFLKIGLPPVHIWFMKLTFLLKKWVFFILSTMHKLFPLLLLGALLMGSSYLLWMLLLTAGSMIFQLFDFFFIILMSSIIHSGWTLLAVQFSWKMGLTYWMFYSLVFLTFLSTVHFILLFKSNVEQSSSTAMTWLVLSGLPPFVMFWLKMWIFTSLVQVSENLSLVLISMSVLALTSYFRAFHTSLGLTYFSNSSKVLFLSLFFLSFS